MRVNFQAVNHVFKGMQKSNYKMPNSKVAFLGSLQEDTFKRSKEDNKTKKGKFSVFETFNNGAESTKVIYETKNGKKVPIGYTYKDERVKGKPRTITMILKEDGEFSATYVNPTTRDKYDYIRSTFEKDLGLTVTDNTDDKERKATVYRIKGTLEGEDKDFVENIIGIYAGTFLAFKP